MTTKPETPGMDGRRQRSRRSRELIINAMLDLMLEGILEPTAQQVSDRAGVGIRSVFRHFEEMASLFDAVNDKLTARNRHLVLGVPSEGPLGDRLDALITSRKVIYDNNQNIIRATTAMMWKYKRLTVNYKELNQIFRTQLYKAIPEVKALSPIDQEYIEACLSFEFWDRLMRFQELPQEDVVRLVKARCSALIRV